MTVYIVCDVLAGEIFPELAFIDRDMVEVVGEWMCHYEDWWQFSVQEVPLFQGVI